MPESPGAEKQDKEMEHWDSKKNKGKINHNTWFVITSLEIYLHFLHIFHSDETLAEYGLLRPEENQDEVKEVLNSPAYLSGCSRQGLY